MACLIKRSNGIYYSVSCVNGRRIWKSTGCRSQAKALILIERNEVEKPKKTNSVTLRQFRTPLFNYLQTNVAKTTMALYNASFNSLERIIGDFPLQHYTPMMVEEFKNVRSKEVSPVKVNIDFRTLRAAFNHAVNWGVISENPFRKCKQVRMFQQRPTYLTKEEFQLLIMNIDQDWFRELIRFAVSTMMRLGEIVNLKWDAVDLNKRLIFIENRNDFHTKTNKARVIPMDELTFYFLSKKIIKTGNIFAFENNKPLSVGYVSRKFKKYVRKAGIREEIHFHSLRHTGATWLVQNNIPLFSVQKLLGHSNIEVTQIYSHLDVEYLRKPLEVFTNIFDNLER